MAKKNKDDIIHAICKRYIVSYQQIKQKAESHLLKINDDDLSYVTVFMQAYEDSPDEEKHFINLYCFFESLNKNSKLIVERMLNNYMTVAPRFVETFNIYKHAL